MGQDGNIYNNPEYWSGETGYRPPGYSDFPINWIKEGCIIFHTPKSILDVGCAFGYSVARLRKLGYMAMGIDISSYATGKAPDEVKPYIVCAPAWKMPFEDKQFDFVFSSGMLEHIPVSKLKRTIDEMVRVGSRGLIGVSCKDDPTTREGADDTHEIILTKSQWQGMFPKEFKVISDSFEGWFNELSRSFFALYRR